MPWPKSDVQRTLKHYFWWWSWGVVPDNQLEQGTYYCCSTVYPNLSEWHDAMWGLVLYAGAPSEDNLSFLLYKRNNCYTKDYIKWGATTLSTTFIDGRNVVQSFSDGDKVVICLICIVRDIYFHSLPAVGLREGLGGAADISIKEVSTLTVEDETKG